MGLITDLGVSIERLLEDFEFSWFEGYGDMQSAIFFDADTYGADQLVPGLGLRDSDLAALASVAHQFPISPEGRAALKTYFTARTDVLARLDDAQRQTYLHSTSYPDFLRQHFGMPEDAVQLFRNAPGGFMGLKVENLPGSYLESMCLVTGVNVGDYRPEWQPEEACVVQFYAGLGTAEPVDLSIVKQTRLTRAWLLEQQFEDFEREIRRVLHGIYGPHGLNVANDILAITVNRWPHGYARDHLDLEDADWNREPAPNVVGRQRCGRIVIANSDAGADACTHVAIDQAWRAVNEFVGI